MNESDIEKSTVAWVKPGGATIELNEEVHTIAKAASLDWSPKEKDDAQRYGLIKGKG